MKLVSSSSRAMLLLAPVQSVPPASFSGLQCDPARFQDLLFETQTFRGKVYLEDGAIQPSQLTAGRHADPLDDTSWHLLVMDNDSRVCGCMRYSHHSASAGIHKLTMLHSAIARSSEWRNEVENAVHAEFTLAQRQDRGIVEAGGWALGKEIRGTVEALRMALASFAWCEEWGGAIGFSTVTERHCSASILRRIGGRSLESNGSPLPSYYEPAYDCRMELLRFHSWAPNPRYRVWVEEIRALLRRIPVITRARFQAASQGRR
jgi:Acetyltransferase (GNAT) domain